MTRHGALRVALVHHAGAGGGADVLAAALRAAGHDARLVAARPVAPVERLLRARGFTGPLSCVPLAAAHLARGGADVVQAFSVPDAVAALAWRRRSGRPVVVSLAETLGRDRVADARQRLRLLDAVLREADAVTAPDAAAQAALERWMLVDAPVVAPDDAAGHERLYRAVLARGRAAKK